MKSKLALLMALGLVTVATVGCHSNRPRQSGSGGTISRNEEFSISVPRSHRVAQGSGAFVELSINRGGDFKRDVLLDIKAKGIQVTPSSKMIGAEDSPNLQVKIWAPADAALGDYHVFVKGTPSGGVVASTSFTVSVVPRE